MKALQLFRPPAWNLVDWMVAGYCIVTGLFIIACIPSVPAWRALLGFRLTVLAALVLLPPRGSAWESPAGYEGSLRRWLRSFVRFLRYAYPLALIVFFFEEVEATVNALWGECPYWFEVYLYEADRFLLGELPAVVLSPWTQAPLAEAMHAFYFSYYLIVVGGTWIAWRCGREAFDTTLTAALLGFLLAFLFYPLLPARGPWENSSLASQLPPFQGPVFVSLVQWIIGYGAVSGGCFPSSHVSGTWGLILGLYSFRRKAAGWLALGAVLMSLACVYTRYHHFVDVPAGWIVGLVGAWIALKATHRSRRAAYGSEAGPNRTTETVTR